MDVVSAKTGDQAARTPFLAAFACAAVACVAVASSAARGAVLPNELSTDVPLTVAARGAVGPHYRPGAWSLLLVTIENRGETFEAAVRVRETRARRATHFVGASPPAGGSRALLRRGTNSVDVLCAPAGAAAGAALEIVRLRPGVADGTPSSSGSENVVFRSDLMRVLRPLSEDARLVLLVSSGETPWKGLPPTGVAGEREVVVSCLRPHELPRSAHAYGSVDLVVAGQVERSTVAASAADALGGHLRGGGRAVLAYFRAMGALERALFGPGARAPVTLDRWREEVPGAAVLSHPDPGGEGAGMPRRVGFHVGLGRAWVFAREPGTPLAEAEIRDARAFVESVLERPPASPWIDAAAPGALSPERPFALAASRARTIAIAAALLAAVAVALAARPVRRAPPRPGGPPRAALKARRRTMRTTAAALAVTGVVWALAAALLWRSPEGAARIVRVRAFTADGRAEAVVDTAVMFAFGPEREFAFETGTAPPLPVARRPGGVSSEAFVLEEVAPRTGARAGRWRLSSLRAEPGRPAVARAVSAGVPDARAERLRQRVLVDGRRARVTTLASGARKAGPDMPEGARYLLERFAPLPLPAGGRESESGEVAWLWVEGSPDGARALGLDTVSPGSGTLVVAAVSRGRRGAILAE